MPTHTARSTFTVASFAPTDWSPEITTGLPTGHAHLVKEFNVVHSSTVEGGPNGAGASEFFRIVPGSGTRALSGITGTGALWVDADGTHHFRLDYDLPDHPLGGDHTVARRATG